MSKHYIVEVIGKQMLLPGIFRFEIKSRDISQTALPGQFLEIKCSDCIDTILRRPISISGVDRENGTVEFIFQARGKATRQLAEKGEGSKLDILGPLGKGFTIPDRSAKAAIVGGGIGIFPLLFLGSELNKPNLDVFLGFRTLENALLIDEFRERAQNLIVSTDDGSMGHHGVITDILEKKAMESGYDMIFACGPQPMLRKVKEAACSLQIPCEISVEERMACGVGACLGCAIKLIDGEQWKYGHVCKDGPVFNTRNVELE